MRSSLPLTAVLASVATTLVAAGPLAAHLAPILTPAIPDQQAARAQTADLQSVQDSYIVVLDDHLEPHELAVHHAHAHRIHADHLAKRALLGDQASLFGLKHTFDIGKRGARKALRGYSGKFHPEAVDEIRALKGVKYVERDSLVFTQDTEVGPPWGLARISHRKPLGFGNWKYEYDGHGGEGVDAYVIDTGVNIDHVELKGRAKWGKTIPNDADADSNGHGSHVAGTIAGSTYGVAKKANIIAVKVLGAGGSGTMSDVVAGVSWASDAASATLQEALVSKNSTHKGSVANMSLGGGKSQALDDAVDAAVEEGLHFAVAAGNDNKDACGYSPAASANAITVGASTSGDERAYFSNTGKCVDVFAPGLNIKSIWNTGNESVNVISGTSMASPHVAGLAAYFLSLYPDKFNVSSNDFTDDAYSTVLDSILGSEVVLDGTNLAQQAKQVVFGAVRRLTGSGSGVKVLAPTKGKSRVLAPKTLKATMISLATKGALTDLDAASPNVLIFNNYTLTG